MIYANSKPSSWDIALKSRGGVRQRFIIYKDRVWYHKAFMSRLKRDGTLSRALRVLRVSRFAK